LKITGKYVFSVVIPTYNRPEVLVKTLRCLEQQETDIPSEVIVVDDGSTLPIPELGLGQGKRLAWKLLRNEKNLGRAATRNRGIREASGEYILMIDDDISASIGLLQAHYDAQTRIGGGVVIGAVPPAPQVRNTVWHRYLGMRYDRIHRRLEGNELDYGLFLTANVSVPLRVLKGVGMFDEGFSSYSLEDTELGYRLSRASVEFSHAPEAVGHHVYEENLASLCKKSAEAGTSAFLFSKLHPEQSRAVQYHSITLGPWNGLEIIKNVAKIILFNGLTMRMLVLLAKFGEGMSLDALVFSLLPWIELAYRSSGAREGRRAAAVKR